MGLLHAFFRASHRHGHHGHHGHHHDSRHGAASRIDQLADRISSRLDLSEAQSGRLTALLAIVQRQRQAIRGDAAMQDLQSLLAGTTLDRAAAQHLVDERLQAVQAAAPALIGALADFYDALDAEQQQVLRFVMRLRQRGMGRGWYGGGRPVHNRADHGTRSPD